jgi:K+-sensing histidine kinase KdpD
MSATARTAESHNSGDKRRLIVAALIPLAAFGLQWIFWNSFKPFAWIFFYPAVFFSAWIGGLRCGLASIVVSTLVIWWFFIPNRYSFISEQPAYAFTMLVFTLA